METLGIVEDFDVVEEHGTSLSAIFWNAILEALSFERREKDLDRCVIEQQALALILGMT